MRSVKTIRHDGADPIRNPFRKKERGGAGEDTAEPRLLRADGGTGDAGTESVAGSSG